MKIKKFSAAALAAVMAIGTMVPSMPVMADSGSTTTVTLDVAAKNEYIMIIPTLTAMNSDGTATALSDGLTIKCENQTKDVEVELTEENDWHLTSDITTTTIGYGVYGSDSYSDTTKITKVDFTKAEIMQKDEVGVVVGTTKDLFVRPDAADLEAAEGGMYSGSITFTATLKAYGTDGTDGSNVAGVAIVAKDGHAWASIAENNENVRLDGNGLVEVRNSSGVWKSLYVGSSAVKGSNSYNSSFSYKLY